MNHPPKEHPSLAELQAFDAGQLSSTERDTIERHVQDCPTCTWTLDTLPEGALEAMLRSVAGPTPAEAKSAAAPEVPPGLIGHPRYRVLEVLGVGGMGIVYKAIHRHMERVVALKVINRSLSDRPGFVERFRREVKAIARLTHPNIVAAYDADEAAGTHFLVMEYVVGTSLDREVTRRGPLTVDEACELVRQAAAGLQHAHERGMVHRDIKPHNLLLTLGGRVKILDFGLARVLDEAGRTSLPSGAMVGTPDYVAPEQARDPGGADIRADIYSLGCTLYHLLAGRPPFPAGTPLQKLLAHQECNPPPLSALRSDIPEALIATLERMLAKDPSARYSTPGDVTAALASLANSVTDTSAKGSPRRIRPIWIGAGAALVALGIFAFIAYRVLFPPGPLPRPPDQTPAAPVQDVAEDSGRLVGQQEFAEQRRALRNQAVDWLRANNARPDNESLVNYVASHIDRDLNEVEAFQLQFGAALLKSKKATLVMGRAGVLHIVELDPVQARDFPIGTVRVKNHSMRDEQRRAVPRVVLSEVVLDGADHLFPEKPLTGKVAYRNTARSTEKFSLRLTFYFGKRKRHVLLPPETLPGTDGSILPFVFPALDDADQVVAGPDVVLIELVTQESGRTIIESNAVAAAVRVMPPEATRSK
jgi:hypothetical protein